MRLRPARPPLGRAPDLRQSALYERARSRTEVWHQSIHLESRAAHGWFPRRLTISAINCDDYIRATACTWYENLRGKLIYRPFNRVAPPEQLNKPSIYEEKLTEPRWVSRVNDGASHASITSRWLLYPDSAWQSVTKLNQVNATQWRARSIYSDDPHQIVRFVLVRTGFNSPRLHFFTLGAAQNWPADVVTNYQERIFERKFTQASAE
jgi:hypothetical protein